MLKIKCECIFFLNKKTSGMNYLLFSNLKKYLECLKWASLLLYARIVFEYSSIF